MLELFEKALNIALIAHRGAVDKGGQPYILHSIRVMITVDNLKEKIVALLHDVIEDSSLTIPQLASEGFPEDVLEAVMLLSRNTNDSYDDYILRIKNNPLACAIKKADLQDNMNMSRLKEITQSDLLRLDKYQRAFKILSE